MKKPNLNINFYTKQIRNNNNIYEVFAAYHNRGILYFKNKYYEKATEDFTYAIDISNTNGCYRYIRRSISPREFNYIRAKEFFLRGIAYIKINNLDKGIDDFKKALDLDSEVIQENKLELNIIPLEIISLIRSFFDI